MTGGSAGERLGRKEKKAEQTTHFDVGVQPSLLLCQCNTLTIDSPTGQTWQSSSACETGMVTASSNQSSISTAS